MRYIIGKFVDLWGEGDRPAVTEAEMCCRSADLEVLCKTNVNRTPEQN